MTHEFVEGADALVMDDRDHVATLLRDMQAGEIRSEANGRADFSDTRIQH